jgi:hypothetical protein
MAKTIRARLVSRHSSESVTDAHVLFVGSSDKQKDMTRYLLGAAE